MVHSFDPVMCCRTTLAGELLWKPSLGTEIYYLGQFCWVVTNPVVMRSTSDCASDELCDTEQVTYLLRASASSSIESVRECLALQGVKSWTVHTERLVPSHGCGSQPSPLPRRAVFIVTLLFLSPAQILLQLSFLPIVIVVGIWLNSREKYYFSIQNGLSEFPTELLLIEKLSTINGKYEILSKSSVLFMMIYQTHTILKYPLS